MRSLAGILIFNTKHDSKYQPDRSHTAGRATRNLDRFAVRRDGEFVVADLNRLFQSDKKRRSGPPPRSRSETYLPYPPPCPTCPTRPTRPELPQRPRCAKQNVPRHPRRGTIGVDWSFQIESADIRSIASAEP